MWPTVQAYKKFDLGLPLISVLGPRGLNVFAATEAGHTYMDMAIRKRT